ncbi:MAG: glycosyltransferase family 2 protein, partial [Gemmataceae bacterium]|nr:glycosyltransferase family 2 protein [Gemmataceae bacterium]
MHVSVIVPLYNKAKYVERALTSISAQTAHDLEILVVDDGSTDGGGDMAERFAELRLRLIRQDNAGPGAARNRGLAEARGEFVAFLDADDEWLPDYLEKNLALLEGSDAACATAGYSLEPDGKLTWPLW